VRAFRTLTSVLAKVTLRDPLGVFFSLALAPALLILYGLAFGNVPLPFDADRGTLDHQLPAIAAWVFAMTGLFVVPTALLSRRDAGTLRRFMATPLRPATYLAADITVNLVLTLASLTLLFAVGMLAFGARGGGSPIAIGGAVLLGSLAFMALGHALAALLPNARSVPLAGNLLALPMLFLSGATAPLEIMPAGVQRAAQFNPLHHMVTLLRASWLGEPWSDVALSLAVVTGLLVVSAALAAMRFRWE
jgi:ABC-2 type transport system permease protein